MQNGIYIGTTPAGIKWICYEPGTLETMREAFEKVSQWQARKPKRVKTK